MDSVNNDSTLTDLRRERDALQEALAAAHVEAADERRVTARMIAARDELLKREATYHDIISELNSVTDPELHPDLQARVDAVLVDCTNPACELSSRLFAAESALADLQQQIAQVAEKWEAHGGYVQSMRSCAHQLRILIADERTDGHANRS